MAATGSSQRRRGVPTRDFSRAVYVISVAAELAGVHPQTLRIYERKGLLDPTRTSGGSRRFSERDLARLRRIQELTTAGLNLEGVRRVLELEAEVSRLQRRARAGSGPRPERRWSDAPPVPAGPRAAQPGAGAVYPGRPLLADEGGERDGHSTPNAGPSRPRRPSRPPPSRRRPPTTPRSPRPTSWRPCWPSRTASPGRCWPRVGVDAGQPSPAAGRGALPAAPGRRGLGAHLGREAARGAGGGRRAAPRHGRRVPVGRAPAARHGRRPGRRPATQLLAALRDVRGSHRVTSPNPEETFQALEKYGRDLTRARPQRASSTRSSAGTRRSAG